MVRAARAWSLIRLRTALMTDRLRFQLPAGEHREAVIGAPKPADRSACGMDGVAYRHVARSPQSHHPDRLAATCYPAGRGGVAGWNRPPMAERAPHRALEPVGPRFEDLANTQRLGGY